MPRPRAPDMLIDWKVKMPATEAGVIEQILWDKVHSKPHYGARNTLIVGLLRLWIDMYEQGHLIVDPFAEAPHKVLDMDVLKNLLTNHSTSEPAT